PMSSRHSKCRHVSEGRERQARRGSIPRRMSHLAFVPPPSQSLRDATPLYCVARGRREEKKEDERNCDMRKLIAGMKISVDGKIEGPEGRADWVAAWSDDYGMMPQIDACLLG